MAQPQPWHEIPGFLAVPTCAAFGCFMRAHLKTKMCELDNGMYSRLKQKEIQLAQDFTSRLLFKAANDEALQAWLGPCWRDCYISPFFFWTRYCHGGYIGTHVDGTTSSSSGKSIATMLLYINDGYGGGQTVFVGPPEQHISPVAGKALLLRQDVMHYAQPIDFGEKLLLRVDVMLTTRE